MTTMYAFPAFLSLLLLLHFCNGFANAACFIHSRTNALRRGMTLQSNKSVNHGTGDFHYSQQPRGTSFISQISKRDLEERRQMRPPFSPQPQQWQPPIPPPPPQQQQQQIVAPQQTRTSTQAAPQTQMSNSMQEFDSISANIKAMTSLLGDVKESLTAQHSDILWLNKKYQEIEKRLERAEIFNTAISQDVSELKSSKTSSVNQSRFGPISGEYEQSRYNRENAESEYNPRDVIEKKDSLHEKLDSIKDQMNRLDIAIKVGEVTLSNHMEEVNRRFDKVKNTDTDGPVINNMNQNEQYQQSQPNTNQQFSQPNNQFSQPYGQPDMNHQFNQPQPNNMNNQFRQPPPPPFEPPPIANQQFSQPNTNQQFNQPLGQPDINQQFNQPQPSHMNNQFRQPPPPPFEPPPIPNEPNQPYPGSFQDPSFQMGSFRYEAPRMGRSYEIPSPRQTLQSKSSANYKNQRPNRSFISAISEQELSQRRELFEPVEPMPFVDGPGEYFDDDIYDFYPPDEPFLGEGGYFEEGLFGY